MFDTTKPTEILTMMLEGEIFAIEAGIVREILDMVPVTVVPGAQAFSRGLINVRGRVVPLADLRTRLGMGAFRPTPDSRIVVIDTDVGGRQTTVGILADKVYQVTEVTQAVLEETPRIGMRWRTEFVRCIGKQADEFIIILDIDKIFNPLDAAE